MRCAISDARVSTFSARPIDAPYIETGWRITRNVLNMPLHTSCKTFYIDYGDQWPTCCSSARGNLLAALFLLVGRPQDTTPSDNVDVSRYQDSVGLFDLEIIALRANLVRMGGMGQQLCANAIMRFVHALESPFDN